MKTYQQLKQEHAINNGYPHWTALCNDNPMRVVDRHYEYVAYAFMREVSTRLSEVVHDGIDEALEINEPFATVKQKKSLLEALKLWKR